jgi:hypothetical protein
MATLGLDSIPMLERYLLKAISIGDTEEVERLTRQILEIKGPPVPPNPADTALQPGNGVLPNTLNQIQTVNLGSF